jgi:hypothetical protein
VRCGSSSFRQAWSKHHWHGYKTHVYTLSLSPVICRGQKKTETKQKDLDSKHTEKKRKFLAKCAIRCDALEETSNQKSQKRVSFANKKP